MGKFLRAEGPTNGVFMSHAKLHKERGTPLLVIENVQARIDIRELFLEQTGGA